MRGVYAGRQVHRFGVRPIGVRTLPLLSKPGHAAPPSRGRAVNLWAARTPPETLGRVNNGRVAIRQNDDVQVSEVDRLVAALRTHGPLTGAELVQHVGLDLFTTWRGCTSDPRILLAISGTRYVRLDLKIDGWARLSPSIGREFASYAVTHLADQTAQARSRLAALRSDTEWTSAQKRATAVRSVARVLDTLSDGVASRVVFLIAGDVVYQMANANVRPESSTARAVRGSDLDIIVIHDDAVGSESIRSVDEAMYDAKWRLLAVPTNREEIDYVVKSFSRASAQVEDLTSFKSAVAAKILHESEYLAGSVTLYDQVRRVVAGSELQDRIDAWTAKAIATRSMATKRLLSASLPSGEDRRLFVGTEEEAELP